MYMSDDQFTKLFGYMSKNFDDIRAQLAHVATKDDIDEIHNRLDGIATRLDDDDTERGALQSQVDRHEGWIKQLGDKTGTDLAVEA